MTQRMTTPQKLWLKALRSGEFEQTTGTLERHGAFCCLGVACKVAEKEGVSVERHGDKEIYGGTLGQQKPVFKWLGLKSVCGNTDEESDVSADDALTKLNDIGMNFKAIAALIAKYPHRYFKKPTDGN